MVFDLSLYLVTDRIFCLEKPLELIVEEAVKGGVTMVQLREKNCSTKEFYDLAIRLKHCLQAYNVPLIINDRVDIALSVDADGVHIGQNDMPYRIVRKILGKHKIIGLSVENMEDTFNANLLDVDYIGISPVFKTLTKTDIATPVGIEGVKSISQLSNHLCVGIGGINMDNAADVILAGANGISVVSAIMGAKDVKQAARDLKKVVNNPHK